MKTPEFDFSPGGPPIVLDDRDVNPEPPALLLRLAGEDPDAVRKMKQSRDAGL
jgi:hypothetical protein